MYSPCTTCVVKHVIPSKATYAARLNCNPTPMQAWTRCKRCLPGSRKRIIAHALRSTGVPPGDLLLDKPHEARVGAGGQVSELDCAEGSICGAQEVIVCDLRRERALAAEDDRALQVLVQLAAPVAHYSREGKAGEPRPPRRTRIAEEHPLRPPHRVHDRRGRLAVQDGPQVAHADRPVALEGLAGAEPAPQGPDG
eukprot:CAMPEP_0179218912 /NCGR_PEP_ID=MMETSP0797-20121207/4731_1 /TAXON_ID=47934 /ORGANISM="Dinophysis acuminata, Strain DAEP01" /LENGTH=195 /DNA_ID=CAMNT_0020925301 /DNA_START=331 /DNA_END=915 /DNA_ORIENTATION=+